MNNLSDIISFNHKKLYDYNKSKRTVHILYAEFINMCKFAVLSYYA